MVWPFDCMQAHGFRSSFTPRRRGAFHHSLTVLSAIGRLTYLALEGGPPSFRPDTTCPVLLRVPTRRQSSSVTRLSRTLAAFSKRLHLQILANGHESQLVVLALQPRSRNA